MRTWQVRASWWKTLSHLFAFYLFGMAWFVTRRGEAHLAWFFVLYFAGALFYAIAVPRGLGRRYGLAIVLHGIFFQIAVIAGMLLNKKLLGADQVLYAALPASAFVLALLGAGVCWLTYADLGSKSDRIESE